MDTTTLLMKSDNTDKYHSIMAALLIAVIIATYWPLFGNQFVAYDDQLYVTENLHVLSGLTLDNVYWAFSSFDTANWHPATWISHQLTVTLFGLAPGAHHGVNLLLHCCNALLLYFFLYRLTRSSWQGFAVASLFALHPLHVESVAWIAERKDLLCTMFFLLTLQSYVSYTQERQQWRLWSSLAFFALSLMSKPMTVTVPVLLLLLDWWPLHRTVTDDLRSLMAEKWAFIVLAFCSCAITIYAQKAGGAMIAVTQLGVAERLSNALTSYLIYLRQAAWPQELAVLYPLPPQPRLLLAAMAAFMLTVATVSVVNCKRSRPYLLFGWTWYIITLLPVIGLLQVGTQSHADRYAYIPMIGCYMAITRYVGELCCALRLNKVITGLLLFIVLCAFGVRTREQLAVWHDSESLFRHAITVTKNNYLMHINLGIELWNHDRQEEAMAEYQQAILMRPDLAEPHFFLANANMVRGNAMAAEEGYAATLRINEDFPYAHTNRAIALQRLGQRNEAIAEFRKGLRSSPADYKAKEGLDALFRESPQHYNQAQPH